MFGMRSTAFLATRVVATARLGGAAAPVAKKTVMGHSSAAVATVGYGRRQAAFMTTAASAATSTASSASTSSSRVALLAAAAAAAAAATALTLVRKSADLCALCASNKLLYQRRLCYAHTFSSCRVQKKTNKFTICERRSPLIQHQN